MANRSEIALTTACGALIIRSSLNLLGRPVTTKLDGTLKRELLIGGDAYTLTLSQQGFTLALKGRRKGLDIRWADLVSGEAALATALNASLTASIEPRSEKVTTKRNE